MVLNATVNIWKEGQSLCGLNVGDCPERAPKNPMNKFVGIMKVRELIKKLADRNMDAEVMVSTGDTYNDVSDFCLTWGGPHSTDSEKDHRDEEFVYIDFLEDIRENAALPDAPVGERIRNSIAMVLTDVDEQVLLNRALTLKAALDWLEKQGRKVQSDVPVDGQMVNSLTEVNEQEFLDRPVTLRSVIDWLASQCKQKCSVCSKTLNNGETMNWKDIEELKKWLCDRGYYVGNSDVAKSLRKLADEFDD